MDVSFVKHLYDRVKIDQYVCDVVHYYFALLNFAILFSHTLNALSPFGKVPKISKALIRKKEKDSNKRHCAYLTLVFIRFA